MGNRGLLHNDRQEIIRHSQLKRWIYCRLEFKNWHRQVMRPGHYTELFFLDEATALAAGHRPCMECQRERATEFKRIWNEVNEPVRTLVEMDEVLYQERTGIRPIARVGDLPNGAMVSDGDSVFLVRNHEFLRWNFDGYHPGSTRDDLTLLTPQSILRVIAAGFQIEEP